MPRMRFGRPHGERQSVNSDILIGTASPVCLQFGEKEKECLAHTVVQWFLILVLGSHSSAQFVCLPSFNTPDSDHKVVIRALLTEVGVSDKGDIKCAEQGLPHTKIENHCCIT